LQVRKNGPDDRHQLKGVLYGIAATLPMFLEGGSGNFMNIRSLAFAIEQADDVDIDDIVLRPTAQEF